MIHIKAVARALPIANASDCAVETVAEPVDGEERGCGPEPVRVVGGHAVRDADHELRDEAERGEVVGVDPGRHSVGEPNENALLGPGDDCLLYSFGVLEFQLLSLPGRELFES